MGPICDELRKANQARPIQAPKTPVYSCMTADRYPDNEAGLRTIMVDQWAHPVRFRETIEKMYADGVRIFVEAGARGNLTHFIRDILAEKPHCAVSCDDAHRSGTSQLNHLIAQLAVQGASLNQTALYQGRSPKQIDIKDLSSLSASGESVGTPKGKEPLLTLAIPYLSVKSPLPAHLPASGSPQTSEDPASGKSVPADSRGQIMKEYLANMDRFLGLQENIMQRYSARKAGKP
jgi:acyl transferase domain-containing protein